MVIIFVVVHIGVAPPLYTQSQNLKCHHSFSGYIGSYLQGEKDFELYLAGKCWSWPPLILTAPFITKKKIGSINKIHGTNKHKFVQKVAKKIILLLSFKFSASISSIHKWG